MKVAARKTRRKKEKRKWGNKDKRNDNMSRERKVRMTSHDPSSANLGAPNSFLIIYFTRFLDQGGGAFCFDEIFKMPVRLRHKATILIYGKG